MATKVTLSSPLAFKTSFLPKSPSLSPVLKSLSYPKTNVAGVKVHAKLGNMQSLTSHIHPVSHYAVLEEVEIITNLRNYGSGAIRWWR